MSTLPPKKTVQKIIENASLKKHSLCFDQPSIIKSMSVRNIDSGQSNPVSEFGCTAIIRLHIFAILPCNL